MDLNISHIEVNRQLELIVAHPDFKGTQPQIALLRYIVGQALSGNSNLIDIHSIAAAVFNRNLDDYDEKNDPIVGIQAGRLKRSLALYYQTVGKNDPIRIDISAGSCVPVFEKR